MNIQRKAITDMAGFYPEASAYKMLAALFSSGYKGDNQLC
jgi:hypothetical protein